MRILCASDMHANPGFAEGILNILDEEDVDVHLNSGDFVSLPFAVSFFKKIKTKTLAVPGNLDYGLKFENKYVKVVNGGLERYKGYNFLCIGFWAKDVKIPEKLKNLILVTHVPPYGILDMSWLGNHAGSIGLRNFLIEEKPILHVFGHIHEAYGVEKFGKTTAINCALPESGKVYLVDLPELKVKAMDLKDWY